MPAVGTKKEPQPYTGELFGMIATMLDCCCDREGGCQKCQKLKECRVLFDQMCDTAEVRGYLSLSEAVYYKGKFEAIKHG